MRVVVRESPDAIERAGFVNERDQSFGRTESNSFSSQHASDEFARVAMAVLHRVDQRQRDFAFLQIAEHGLAQLLCGGGEIE